MKMVRLQTEGFLKYLMVFLFLLLAASFTHAQSPMQFNFQAAARYPSGILMTDLDITVRLTVRNESPAGQAEYTETRRVHTNQVGMFTIAIGSSGALSSSGTLQNVQWRLGKKYLQVEVDPKGGNSYIDVGSTQLLSVPFALFALETARDSASSKLLARNGVSVTDSAIQLGNAAGDTSAALRSDREILLSGKSLRLFDGSGEMRFSKALVTMRPDSTLRDTLINGGVSGGAFMMINPIHPRADAVPFLFSRTAHTQNRGATSPNEVVIWGHNIGGDGLAYLGGLPGIGYSLESNYKPLIDSRLVESHEFYITPQNKQVRLKSYTIDTKTNHIDFYHSVDNFYLKSPLSGTPYYYIYGSPEGGETQYVNSAGTFYISSSSDKSVGVSNNYSAGNRNFYFNNWDNILVPGVTFSGGATRFQTRTIPETDNTISLGDAGNRWMEISAHRLKAGKLILKPNWLQYENIQPTATLDIAGDDGSSQLRLRTPFTPISSNDTRGETGSTAWDENYFYIKTSSGWKRAGLSAF